jgi:hypothetical protein
MHFVKREELFDSRATKTKQRYNQQLCLQSSLNFTLLNIFLYFSKNLNQYMTLLNMLSSICCIKKEQEYSDFMSIMRQCISFIYKATFAVRYSGIECKALTQVTMKSSEVEAKLVLKHELTGRAIEQVPSAYILTVRQHQLVSLPVQALSRSLCLQSSESRVFRPGHSRLG